MWALLERVRPTNRLAMTLAIVGYSAVLLLSNVAQSGPIGSAIDSLARTTNGWVAAQIVYPSLALCLVVISLFGPGGLRCGDIGWRASGILPALVVTVLFWIWVQVSLLFVGWISDEPLTWQWQSRFGWSIPGALLSQMLGNSLVEETFFRGFLLPQVYHQVSRVLRRGPSLVAAALVSLSLFVLSHVPSLPPAGLLGDAAGQLSFVFAFGLILTLTFLMTRNLFICVGLHSLWNARPIVIDAGWETVDSIWWVLTITLLLGWWLCRVLVPGQAENTPGRSQS